MHLQHHIFGGNPSENTHRWNNTDTKACGVPDPGYRNLVDSRIMLHILTLLLAIVNITQE